MKRKWIEADLIKAVKSSTSIRQVLVKISLVEAGGNYEQVKKWIKILKIDNSHFTGKGWSKGKKRTNVRGKSLSEILVNNSDYQSYKLKKRLIKENIKQEKCEECGWAKKSKDGRIPLELDHINGIKCDNRLKNLRILCPNCHSLKITHRGKNKKNK